MSRVPQIFDYFCDILMLKNNRNNSTRERQKFLGEIKASGARRLAAMTVSCVQIFLVNIFHEKCLNAEWCIA